MQQIQDINRDSFFKTMIKGLTESLDNVIGDLESSSFVSMVGGSVGQQLNDIYKTKYRLEQLNKEQIAEVLVDLKKRIGASFKVVELTPEKIVMENYDCPFGDVVKGRKSLCMMTSNVFGKITAENTGYAKISLEKTIANGNGMCRVIVYLEPGEEAENAHGREYFQSLATAQ